VDSSGDDDSFFHPQLIGTTAQSSMGDVLDDHVLTSPTDIISEQAIQETMRQMAEGDLNDTGMGPGRIRKYATQGAYCLKKFNRLLFEIRSIDRGLEGA
jgi:hypothetical protein